MQPLLGIRCIMQSAAVQGRYIYEGRRSRSRKTQSQADCPLRQGSLSGGRCPLTQSKLLKHGCDKRAISVSEHSSDSADLHRVYGM